MPVVVLLPSAESLDRLLRRDIAVGITFLMSRSCARL